MTSQTNPLRNPTTADRDLASPRNLGALDLFLRLFSRRWIVATLLVAGVMAGMIRLGFWQLDRLEQRRAFNARVQIQLNQPVLDLNAAALSSISAASLSGMEYRAVEVRGEYDPANQVALRNQVWENQTGVRLLTPLHIQGSQQVVMVDRGWVPTQSFTAEDWSSYDEPGQVRVQGVIRAAQSRPDFGNRTDPTPAPGEAPLKLWHFANLEAISAQLPYSILPVYIQQAPDAGWSELPYRSQPELDLTEGPHQGYALQWFTFALIAGGGYLVLVFRREKLGRSNDIQPVR